MKRFLLTSLLLFLTAAALAETPRHLLITFPWSTKNIGDIAITPGLLSLIREADPDLKTVIITSRGLDTENYRELKDYLPRYYPGSEVLAYPFVLDPETKFKAKNNLPEGRAWRALYERWGSSQLRGFENGSLSARIAAEIADDILNRFPHEMLEELKETNPEAARAFTDAGFLLYTSGTTLNFGRMGVRNLRGFTLRYGLPLLLARAQGIPYGINAQSFDALDWPSNLIFGPLFKDARFVYARDPDSLEYLRQQHLLSSRSGWRPDTTFFFSGSDEEWADAFMKEHQLEKEKFITVTIRSANQRGPLAGMMSPEREDLIMGRIRQFIEDWIVQTDLPVVLAPEVESEVEAAHERIFTKLSPAAQKKTIELDSFWTTEQAYSLYQRAQTVVSMEMHSVIMALSLGTPVLMPQFSENGRKVWMLDELGLRDWIFDIDEPSSAADLLGAALKIEADLPAAQERVRVQLPRIRQLGLSVITEVKTGWRK